MGDVTTQHTIGRGTRYFKRVGMAWWMSGLAVLFLSCGGSEGTQTTTTLATTTQAPAPTQSATPEPDAADPCIPRDILRHLLQLLGEPHAAVNGRTCGR
jgi:hypothetical protein